MVLGLLGGQGTVLSSTYETLAEKNMQRYLRIACIGYVVLLTLLLLSVNPVRILGFHGRLPSNLQALMPSAHLISFFVLAVVMLMARWPIPRWSIILILAVYGGLTELVQGFVPPRTPDWTDWFQDIGGLAIGVTLCWMVVLVMSRTSFPQLARAIAGMVFAALLLTPANSVAVESPRTPAAPAMQQDVGAVVSHHADV